MELSLRQNEQTGADRTEPELPESNNENLCSEIIFKFSESVEEATGFKLETTPTGHFIKWKDRNINPMELNLRDNDRLLAINENLVIYWNHWIVLESLKYLLYFSEPRERLSLIIDRQDNDGNVDIYEICITVIRSRDKTGEAVSDIEIDLGDAFLEIRSFLKRITYIPRMRSIKFKQLFQCRIRHAARTNCYLKINEKMKLVIETMSNEKEDFWKFDCYLYQGLKLSTEPRTAPSSVFICVLRSCHSFNGQRPYILAKSCEKVGATCFRTLNLDDRQTESTDPRFFRVIKTENGKNLIESLIYKGYYLTWNNLSGKPNLTRRSREDILLNVESFSACCFEILSDDVLDIK